jgi:hypothetical protein
MNDKTENIKRNKMKLLIVIAFLVIIGISGQMVQSVRRLMIKFVTESRIFIDVISVISACCPQLS